jgi:hypothetical protein
MKKIVVWMNSTFKFSNCNSNYISLQPHSFLYVQNTHILLIHQLMEDQILIYYKKRDQLFESVPRHYRADITARDTTAIKILNFVHYFQRK